MYLRRPVGSRVFAVVVAALLVGFDAYLVNLQFTVRGSVSGRLCIGGISLIVLLVVVSFLRYALQRFQVDVDRDGWTVRIGRYRRDLRWAEISAVVIKKRENEGAGSPPAGSRALPGARPGRQPGRAE
ncbi:hypothetical protein [Micromonospora gifhornensis]|uniref:hypothetical protein n=1 Tax=Micromonospora gifhornensis TaxID=84594 RepID=UPI003655494A